MPLLPKLTGKQALVAVALTATIAVGGGWLASLDWDQLSTGLSPNNVGVVAEAQAQQRQTQLQQRVAKNSTAIDTIEKDVGTLKGDVTSIKSTLTRIEQRLPDGSKKDETSQATQPLEGSTLAAEVTAEAKPVVYEGRKVNWAGRPYVATNLKLEAPGNVQEQREVVRHEFGLTMAKAYTLLCAELSMNLGADVCSDIDRGSAIGGYGLTEQEVTRYRHLLGQFTTLVDFVDTDAKTGGTSDKRHQKIQKEILVQLDDIRKQIKNNTFRIEHLEDVVAYIWAGLYGEQVVPLWVEFSDQPSLTPAHAVRLSYADLDPSSNTVRVGAPFGAYIADINAKRGNVLNIFFTRPEVQKSEVGGMTSVWGIINVTNGDATQLVTGGKLPLVTATDLEGNDRKGRLLFATRLRSPCGGTYGHTLSCIKEDLVQAGVAYDTIKNYFDMLNNPAAYASR